MHELQVLKEKRTTFLTTAQNIVNRAIGEARSLTQQETDDVAGLRAKAEAITATIKAAEELRGLAAAGEGTGTGVNGGRFLPGSTSGDGTGSEGRPFESLGSQLRSIVSAARGQVDPKLHEVRAVLGANETVGSEGAFLIQRDFSTALLTGGMKKARLAPLCRPFPLSSAANAVSLPMVDETSRVAGSRSGGLRLGWGDEADAITTTKPKFKLLELKLKKLMGGCYLTDELVSDSSALESFVQKAFEDEFGFVIDDAIIRGNGAGQPLGFLNSGSLVTVSKESGQAADTILTENLVKAFARNSDPGSAVWLCHIDALPQLATLSLTVGTGGSAIGVLKDGIATSPTGFAMLGRPVIWMEQAATLGDLGDVMFVDPSQYILATKGALQTAVSIHVQFLTAQQVLRFIYRIDGQPAVSTPLTPANGSNTTSPFVVLQAR